MNTKVMFSSEKMDWTTPPMFFQELDREFHFTLDAAASDSNHLCKRYFTEKEDALKQKWTGRAWLNSPYGRQIGKWVKKAYEEVECGNAELVVMLLPARTDTKYFHQYCMKVWPHGIRFIKGRLKFGDGKNSAPFPSMVVIFKKYAGKFGN